MAADAIIAVNVRKSIVFFNRSAEATFGYAAEEVRTKPLKLLFRGGLTGFHPERIGHLESFEEHAWATSEQREIVGRRKDGSEFPAQVSLCKIKLCGETILNFILRDVTSRVSIEERLRAALREKEVLFEEVHHRVKNNLPIGIAGAFY